MPKYVRWIALAIGGLIGLLVLAVGGVYGYSSYRMSKTYTVPTETVVIPTDAAAIARGSHLVHAVGKCVDCHGQNLAGGPVIDDPAIGTIVAANLTKGKGGVAGHMADADFVRALRHGVSHDGRPLLLMPAQDFRYFSDADLGAVIAYVKSVPAVDSELPAMTAGPLGRVLLVTGNLPNLIPAELIDHTAARPTVPPVGVTVEYGKYLLETGGCKGCHGDGLSGGHVPGTPPTFKDALNITPSGGPGTWSEADFIKTLRTGVNPGGYKLDEFMPWKAAALMTDDEIKALFMFLKTVPPRATGTR